MGFAGSKAGKRNHSRPFISAVADLFWLEGLNM